LFWRAAPMERSLGGIDTAIVASWTHRASAYRW